MVGALLEARSARMRLVDSRLDALRGQRFKLTTTPLEWLDAGPCAHPVPHIRYMDCVRCSDSERSGARRYYGQDWVLSTQCPNCLSTGWGVLRAFRVAGYRTLLVVPCPSCRGVLEAYLDFEGDDSDLASLRVPEEAL